MYLNQNDADAAAVRQCLNGDSAAFEELVHRYQRPLFNVALRVLGRYDEAGDATQNAFVKAYTRLDTFDSSQRFFSWIYRILKNESLNVLRARREWEPLSDDCLGEVRPGDAIEFAERHRAIQAALMGLSVEYREVVVLRHFANLSYDEIAVALDVPAKTIKSRLYSARQRLSEVLIEWKSGI